jgi:hypothetical protein
MMVQVVRMDGTGCEVRLYKLLGRMVLAVREKGTGWGWEGG